MYYVVVDIGCSDCGEASNVVGVFTEEDKARTALEQYKKANKLDLYGDDHQFLIYGVKELNQIHNDSFDHCVYDSNEE
ncbi:hypothetical protein SLL00_14060 [Metabacillus indicus]|uniref:hypothetical protein n=1 Tax=Metabacillus indicus TaxID=246786 RepID=UPI002A041DEA|nr:hypothetical protein [Metabacillus indicus]MDX8290933.1 hypothetical protein [Metabacillus indicus]